MRIRKECLVSFASLARLFAFSLLEFPFSRALSTEQSTSIVLLSSWSLRSTADLLNGRWQEFRFVSFFLPSDSQGRPRRTSRDRIKQKLCPDVATSCVLSNLSADRFLLTDRPVPRFPSRRESVLPCPQALIYNSPHFLALATSHPHSPIISHRLPRFFPSVPLPNLLLIYTISGCQSPVESLLSYSSTSSL